MDNKVYAVECTDYDQVEGKIDELMRMLLLSRNVPTRRDRTAQELAVSPHRRLNRGR